MATYKRRGNKPVGKQEREQQEQKESTTAEVFSTLDESASKTEEWVARNQKYIIGFIAVIAVGVLGYLGYNEFIVKPKEVEASNELYFAQQYFEKALNTADSDSLYNLALTGAEGKYGLLDIIDIYGGTDAANLAHYSAGMAYLNTGKYDKAIEHLQEFSSDDAMLGPIAKGGIGDAFNQLNQPEEALSYYEQAFKRGTNDFVIPRYLMKAALTAMSLSDYKKAHTYFTRIKEEFPSSPQANGIDTYIGKVENMK
ncbi:tetratricopeptide repeat protein [Ascidiimonas aurantiaca]|uniref:tetratricopeptide repeat protein n=1 Tax=Ascidiimonas aurantiaca TaxID=1685432 RepID=UPI0030EBCB29